MSTLPAIRVEETAAWKQEVSRKLAAHKNHKGAAPAQRQGDQEARAGKRAADAAARVAARFAKAPSYSQMLAEEARAAVRAAEAASQAALHAQAAAESVLASLEADMEERTEAAGVAAYAEPKAGLFPVAEANVMQPPAEQTAETAVPIRYSVQWDRELPVNRVTASEMQAIHQTGWERGWQAIDEQAADVESVAVVEAAQPIPANLIEFPRELVAARKARPRLAEGPLATPTETGSQLSIFEVDPGTISTEPAAAESTSATVEPTWTGPEWRSIQLDGPAEELLEEPEPQPRAASPIELASMSRRLMATVVDASLIAAAFLAAATMAVSDAKGIPATRVMETATALGLLAIGALYKTLFTVLATTTPGMRYAGVRLATFGGEEPTRAQRCNRLIALLLSVLPVGLGVMWAIFDEEHLSWHDRLSKTYVRQG